MLYKEEKEILKFILILLELNCFHL